MRIGSLSRPVCLAGTGAMRRRSERSSGRHSPKPVCPISTRTASATRLSLLGEKLCRTPEEFKAWSQNLGHEKVLTTFSAYGAVAATRQTEIIRELGERTDTDDRQLEELARQVVRVARRTTV